MPDRAHRASNLDIGVSPWNPGPPPAVIRDRQARRQGRRHPLPTVLAIATAATLSER